MSDKKIKITSIETAPGGDDLLDESSIDANRKTGGPDVKMSDVLQRVTPDPDARRLDQPLHDETPLFGWARPVGVFAWLIWILVSGLVLFVALRVQDNWQSFGPWQWLGIVTLVLGPALLILLATYTLKQLARLTALATTYDRSARQLLTPDDSVREKSAILAQAIRGHIDTVNDRLNAALGRLAAMDDVVKEQAMVLERANLEAKKTSEHITNAIKAQETSIASMAETMDRRMAELSDMITKLTDKLTRASQMSEQKIKEARISIETATAKLNAASDVVRSNTVQAASTLSTSHEDIKALGDIIRKRSEELDQVYKRHGDELTAMIEHLREEQQVLGANMEERLTKMRDLSLSAQASAESLMEASHTGKDTIEALAEAATLADNAVKARFAEMREMVEYSTEHAKSISDLAARRVRDSLELTRKEISRIEADMAELQNRIANPATNALELVAEPEEAPRPDRPRRRWTRLKLKPAPDDLMDDITDDIDASPVKTEDSPGTNDSSEPALRGAKPVMEAEPDPLEIPGPPLDLTRDNKIEEGTNLQDESPQLGRTTPKSDSPVSLQSAPISKPEDVKRSDEETIRRTIPADPEDEPHEKPGLFRSLFGRKPKTPETSSLDIVSKPAPGKPPTQAQDRNAPPLDTSTPNPQAGPPPLSPQKPPSADELFLADLEKLGLSANAVVDDGCVIEATNSRVAHGHAAMSRAVAERLKSPVEHLVKSLAVDDLLSSNAIAFATRFNRSLELKANDREALRLALESEIGRAFLLCDAALNYGRV